MTTTTAPPPLIDVVRDIADALGEGWAVTAQYHGQVDIAGPRGEAVAIRRDVSTGTRRLTMYAIPPRELAEYRYRSDGPPDMGVNGDRGAAAVAADMHRRLLPGARDAVALARLRQVAALADAAYRDDLVARVAAALGAAATVVPASVRGAEDPRGTAIARLGAYGHDVHARVAVPAGDGTAEVTVTVAQGLVLELAAAVGRVIADHDDARPPAHTTYHTTTGE